jgi:two-component sensor histidine kinase
MVGLPSGTRLTLRSDTNDVLARWPETQDTEQDLSKLLVFTVGLSEFRAQVRVKRPYTDIFAEWRLRALTSGAVTLVIIAGFGVLTFFGLRSANAEQIARANLLSANRHLEERVSERTAELAKSEARLSVILSHLPVGVGVVDTNGRLLLSNRELDRFVEPGCAGNGPNRDGLPDLLLQHQQPKPNPPDGEVQYQSGAFPAAAAHGGKSVDVKEVRYSPPSGGDVWMQVRTVPLDDPASDPQDTIVVVVDVTAMKRSQQRLTLLLNELNHRVKNTLATVQAIVSQTMRGADAQRQVRDAVNARLLALSKAHNLLTKESWAGTYLPNLVDEALAPFRGESEPSRFRVAGPKVWLSPRATLALGMALHELATNAVKYGALSNATGTVSVTWASADDRLALRWEEQGGPHVREPSRKGFGSRLIENGVAEELGGHSAVHYHASGFVWEIELPLGDGHMGTDFDIADTAPAREVENARL